MLLSQYRSLRSRWTNLFIRKTNVLIDRNLCVRLADFGLALFADSGTASVGSHIGGSTRWMCPKLLSGDLKRPNNSCDIYSFGCVCVEVSVNCSLAATVAKTLTFEISGVFPPVTLPRSQRGPSNRPGFKSRCDTCQAVWESWRGNE